MLLYVERLKRRKTSKHWEISTIKMLNNTSFNASAQGDQPNLCTYVILFKHIAKYIQCTGEQLSIANTHWYVLHAPVHWVVEILKRRIANTDPVHYWRWSATLGNCCQAVFPIVDIFLHRNSSLHLAYIHTKHTSTHWHTQVQNSNKCTHWETAVKPYSRYPTSVAGTVYPANKTVAHWQTAGLPRWFLPNPNIFLNVIL